MVRLVVSHNIVMIDKNDNSNSYQSFVTRFLIKYEEIRKRDPMSCGKKKKPKFITIKESRNLYVDDGSTIYFSRGLLDLIPSSEYEIVSEPPLNLNLPEINKEEIRTSLKTFDLRDDQVVAVVKCLSNRRGVVQLPTATGKSSIIASTIIQILKKNPDAKILVLAPTLSTVKGINSTFIKNGINSEIFGHPSKEIRSSVTVALVQSLISNSKEHPDFLDEINSVFYDECLPANAEVLLPDGSKKRISRIYDDDDCNEVLSYNIETNSYEINRIVRKYKTPFNQKFWKVYYYDSVRDEEKGVTLTDTHKIYTKRGYVEARDLTDKDYIKVDFLFVRSLPYLSPTTFMKVTKVVSNVGGVAEYKYNLEIENTHNYFASDVLVSNCHHLKCDTWNQLNLLLRNVDYSLGFSALAIDRSEIYKTDIRNISYNSSLIIGSSGKVILHMDPSYYIEKGIIALPVVIRVETGNFLCDYDESSWTKLVSMGIMSSPRTSKIAQVASIFKKYSRKSLVLVSTRSHAFTVGRFLAKLGVTDYGISFGAGTGYVYQSYDISSGEVNYSDVNSFDVIDMLTEDKLSIVIGTNHIDEGVDISKLDSVILACGGKSDRKIVQRVGRALRKSKTGKYAYIIDFTDSGNKVLSRHSQERLKLYKNTIGIPEELIYDKIQIENFESEFIKLEGLT